MKSRPWPILILAGLQCLFPVWGLVLHSLFLGLGITDLALLYMQQSPQKLVSLFLLMPLAGVAITYVRKWSYPIFLILLAGSIHGCIDELRSAASMIPAPILGLMIGLDILAVGYFLLPAVREFYFNPKIRWWESKPRYRVQWPALMSIDGGPTLNCNIVNLSDGGAFLETRESLAQFARFRLEFGITGFRTQVNVEVVYGNPGSLRGYGVKFLHSPESKEIVAQLVQALDRIGADKLQGPLPLGKDFSQWLSELLHSGKGLVPELPTDREPTRTTPNQQSG